MARIRSLRLGLRSSDIHGIGDSWLRNQCGPSASKPAVVARLRHCRVVCSSLRSRSLRALEPRGGSRRRIVVTSLHGSRESGRDRCRPGATGGRAAPMGRGAGLWPAPWRASSWSGRSACRGGSWILGRGEARHILLTWGLIGLSRPRSPLPPGMDAPEDWVGATPLRCGLHGPHLWLVPDWALGHALRSTSSSARCGRLCLPPTGSFPLPRIPSLRRTHGSRRRWSGRSRCGFPRKRRSRTC